ncbi:hypothetical protein G4X40_11105 [Rhodococcus sp. D2-41]|uniref:Knr4/Smi1-like domain-containing protein n=1 Tax=Speluncibacter jeojiensis TaxID=2710754 RepID=A0A9X4LWH5_9ACTN|nr:hypothetical protein [Rhodococcus sp. D2-41]MDG3010697.1 hypothetical protein [Rhodococcus sp. D2-41]MDG3013678.1 hypothetical protein [Corynebacteriales bacterium D3-21]
MDLERKPVHRTVHTRDLYFPRIQLGDRFDPQWLAEGKILAVCGRQVIICTGLTFGPTDLSIQVLADGAAPATTVDQWETVEEASVWLDAPVQLVQVHGEVIEGVPELDAVTTGLHHVRVYARGRDRTRDDVACHIEIERAEAPRELTLIADGDNVRIRDLYSIQPRRHSDRTRHANQKPDAARLPLAAAWQQLVDALSACGAHTTLTSIAPPVSPQLLDGIRDGSGLNWPHQLAEFYALHDGLQEWTQLLPQHDVLSIAAADQLRRETSAIWGEFDDPATYEGAQAGESTGTFLPQYFPIAERDAYILFCDTRPGPRHGCISEHRREDADILAPYWASLAHMVTDLADSITNGTPFMTDWTPSVEEGRLVWTDQA